MKSILGADSPLARSLPAPVAMAQRMTRPRWRDLRLWLGVILVAGSVLAGARIMAAADDTILVWSAERDLAAGEQVTSDDLSARAVRFVEGPGLAEYLLAETGVPEGTRVGRSVGAGELLPRSALAPATDTGVIEVPVAVDAGQLPPSVGAGSIVSVWVAGEVAPTDTQTPRATLVLADVVVIEAPRVTDAFGAGAERQLVLGVPVDQAGDLAAAVGAAASGRVVITRQG